MKTQNIDILQKENLELRDAVKKYKTELKERNREAQVEAALERVRARSMSMHKSEELADLSLELVKQVQNLGVKTWFCAFNIYDEDPRGSVEWGSNGEDTFPKYLTPREGVFLKYYEAGQNGETLLINEIGEDECPAHYDYLCSLPGVGEQLLKMKANGIPFPTSQIDHVAYFKYGYIIFITYEPVPESYGVFKRFAKIFEQTYTRFLDLKKAEEKSWELQIENSLEKVRAESMAMKKPEDLLAVCEALVKELQSLGFSEIRNAMINIYKENDYQNYDYSLQFGRDMTRIPYSFYPPIDRMIRKTKTAKNAFFEFSFRGKDLEDFRQKRKENGEPDDPRLDEIRQLHYYFYAFENGSIGISTYKPVSEEKLKLLKRFRNVFNLAYKRYNDIALAEAQAREAQVEAALERVRSRSMAMHNTEELAEAAEVLNNELTRLGLRNINQCGYGIYHEEKNNQVLWLTRPGGTSREEFTLPIKGEAILNERYKSWKKQEPLCHQKVTKKQFESHLDLVFDQLGSKVAQGIAQKEMPDNPHFYCANFRNGYLHIVADDALDTEQEQIMVRFARVFSQTYTRFLDLQKAEAQARESEIQLALERVRARTMAMQHSEELKEASEVLHQQVRALGIETWGCAFHIYADDPEGDYEWFSSREGTLPFYKTPRENFFLKFYEKGKAGESFHVEEFIGEDCKAHYDFLMTIPVMGDALREIVASGAQLPESQFDHIAFFEHGFLLFITYKQVPESHSIFQRFAKVFEQTYTRFLDLKKAESQARESEIQLALERVRARTMAMHKSEELGEVASVLFEQISSLTTSPDRFNIAIANEEDKSLDIWITDQEGHKITQRFIAEVSSSPVIAKLFQSWKKRENHTIIDLYGENLENWVRYMGGELGVPFKKNSVKDHRFVSSVFFSHGFIGITTNKEPDIQIINLLGRFSKVFNQTYTRFLDLQKAEAQAREAQIEAALERVRSRSMAMHKTEELADAIGLLQRELAQLEFALDNCIFWIIDKESNEATLWVAPVNNTHLPEPYRVPFTSLLYFKEVFKAWKLRNAKWTYVLEGEEKKRVDEYLFNQTDFRNFPTDIKRIFRQVKKTYVAISFYNYGGLHVSTEAPISESQREILSRFSKVFDQTYTRFLDLQKAEAQARESQIQLALERVRARTMAMQKSDELAEASVEVFKQLIELGIEPNRLFIGIIESGDEIETWATNEDGTKIASRFILDTKRNKSIKEMYRGWKEQKKSMIIDMKGEVLKEYFHYLANEKKVPFKGGLSQKRRIQYLAFFSKGFIGMASPNEQPPETLELLKRFAAVFNLTFTRFNDLKIAEANALKARQDLVEIKAAREKAETALAELKATQQQLVQSEKMASLGQLTAGIAHEIKNPLNFVNNFSEVSKELLEEMNEELKNGNYELVAEIAGDVNQNLEKILHHGKRADGIVKGMLQHSRSNSGHKEEISVNNFVDEYLRLAYHGLRAKDKSFNAKMENDFDPGAGKIVAVPQELGRVILNLVTNAFYAVTEKKKKATDQYDPTVWISTHKQNEFIEIKVRDNGTGIPKELKDKIFQPFFTTKPTGQGTGLGLSLSYDIIKAHGGEIKVQTEEGKGTTFEFFVPVHTKVKA